MTKDVLPPAVRQALERGNPIEAIKLLREEKGLGLAEAKNIIDVIRRELPNVGAKARPVAATSHVRSRPGLSPGQVADGGSAAKSIALIVVAVIVIIVALYF